MEDRCININTVAHISYQTYRKGVWLRNDRQNQTSKHII